MTLTTRISKLEEAARNTAVSDRAVVIRESDESEADAIARSGAPRHAFVVQTAQQAYLALLPGGRLYPLHAAAGPSTTTWLATMGLAT
ncbi:hypothetical protein [Hydrogenophaga sp.]|uniref:hypothetical protein n=1 Tax=Hydrogenophaga sp. TaxID=1904254 RepID=UPI002731A71A|nr:hypothetical protein [Hydrogenophaga sp.]MDP2073341.1 hypothetical protein [Hydrogenophaga sp.]MDP3348869.1 hypothetical protein [Hydrogenophaga sp.]